MSNIITNTTVNPTPDTVVFIQTKNDVSIVSVENALKDRDYDLIDVKSALSRSESTDLTAEYETPIELNPVGVAQTVLKALYNLTFYNHCIYQ
ncbi:MAG TPA: hypothetical protein PK816_02795 [Candidatus Cloacimonadota bacterium]|nr:hypothetical protein [Candidatus Cloacimonadota bacterium]